MTDPEKKPRPWGTGSVYQHRGSWRARLPGRYGRKNVDGSYDTREAAEAVLAAALEMLAAAPLDAPTLASFGEAWLGTDGGRDVRASVLERDRLRWSAYIEYAPIATMPIVEVQQHDVETWLARLRGQRKAKLSAQTKQNALSLLRQAFEAARARGGPLHGRPNPAEGVTLGKRERAATSERWTWLREAQIATVLSASIPLRARLVYTVAIYSGLRAGEMWGLRRSDLDFDRRVISVGHSRGEATKTGRPREVPMLPPVADALRQWLALCDAAGTRSHLGLVWPATDGGYHAEGYDAGWSEHAAELGLGHATFHDLRHTCASHLVMGTWAPALLERALRIEEVAKWLGHKDIKTTQRYAHLAPEAIAGLVRSAKAKPIRVKVRALRSGTPVGTQSQAASGNRTPGLRFTKAERGPQLSADFLADSGAVSSVVSQLRRAAERAAEAIHRADPHRDHRALDLIETAIAACEALTVAPDAEVHARCAPREGRRLARR